MVKKYLSILLLLSILLYAIPTLSAQDATYKCDLPTMQAALDGLIGALGKVKVGGETDPVKIANVIEQVAITANIMRASCDGLVFKDKKQTVVGPIEIPKGLYKLKLETKSTGYIGVEASSISGECGGGISGSETLLFNVGGANFPGEGEIVFQSSGCNLLIQVNIADAPWTLSFERLSTQ